MGVTYPEIAGDSRFYQYMVIGCGASISLLCGTPNTIQNIFGEDFEEDLGLSSSEVSVLSAIALLGMYFTIPAGLLIDKFGPYHVTVGGSFAALFGFVLSFLANKDNIFLIYIGVLFVGFGSGAAFISAMQASLAIASEYAGKAVAIVGGGLSLSMSFIILIRIVYNEASGCSGASCWREHFYVITIIASIMMIVPSFFFKSAPRPKSVESQITDTSSVDSTTIDRQVTLSESLSIFRHGFFWALFFGYLTSIGTGLLILTQISNMWEDFDKSGDDWSEIVSLFYSLSTFLGGLISGAVSDHFKNRDPNRIIMLSVFILFAVANIGGIAFMLLSPSSDDGLKVLFAILITNVGISFGSYFTFYPVITGEVYGNANFGKYFGYIQLASSAASVIVPILGEQVESAEVIMNIPDDHKINWLAVYINHHHL
eukprot:TRINITY_DN8050_c0_g1_i13.p1 TRINITY_DN8050_c0_g1~~TRINITY_DN8050_c0_g1_i13.p1  ORF type:complete len:428 (+),score=79.61 TRINITY_DN8050_c0_g1_i13:80-1363(+)